MSNPDTNARREAEYWVVQDAYDYALALMGYERSSSGPALIAFCPSVKDQMIEMARDKLLSSAKFLGPSTLVDARLSNTMTADRRLP